MNLPTVVSGRIGKAEDVDWYAFDLAKGERVGFEVWGNRLENKIHDLQTHLDPILSLHDSTGRELAAADNNHFADPVLDLSGALLPAPITCKSATPPTPATRPGATPCWP